MISAENLFAYWIFAIVASATPGPNNMMALAASAQLGFVRSMPLVLGVAAGVTGLIISVGLGLGTVFEALPWLYDGLRIVGASWLLYLAWRIATAGVINDGAHAGSSLGFIEGVTFQFINPKAWMIALSIVSTYVPSQRFVANVLLLAIVFGLTAIAAVSLWAAFGSSLRRWLSNPRTAVRFNRAMGVALASSVVPILLD